MSSDLRSRAIASLEADGLTVTEWTDEPSVSYQTHSHRQLEVRIVLAGSMTITIDGTARRLGPGDRVDIPAHAKHSAVVGRSGVHYLAGSDR